jgi:hypothetical protein
MNGSSNAPDEEREAERKNETLTIQVDNNFTLGAIVGLRGGEP